MIPAELLRRKRDGATLSSEDIAAFVEGVVQGSITRAQAAAFLMAACIRGLDEEETAALTLAMARSGRQFDWSHLGYAVDKHSTGGVGDKLSLLVAPLAAAAGALVPMMSGRALGHTGGTVDKLESIVGFRTELPDEHIERQLRDIGVVMLAQSAQLAPADRIFYALRDETGTVESIGLITASILSKKIAAGVRALVMDVKCGRGAFMQRFEDAQALAAMLARIGQRAGLSMRVFITDMNDPLGYACGNWVEVEEAERALRTFEAAPADIRQLSLTLAGAMLVESRIAATLDDGIARAEEVWRSGRAWEVFHRMVAAQGGQWEESCKRAASVPSVVVTSTRSGYVAGFATRAIGLLLVELGAGRLRASDTVDPAAGIVFHRKRGDAIEAGEPLATVFASDAARLHRCAPRLLELVDIADEPPAQRSSWILEQVA